MFKPDEGCRQLAHIRFCDIENGNATTEMDATATKETPDGFHTKEI